MRKMFFNSRVLSVKKCSTRRIPNYGVGFPLLSLVLFIGLCVAKAHSSSSQIVPSTADEQDIFIQKYEGKRRLSLMITPENEREFLGFVNRQVNLSWFGQKIFNLKKHLDLGSPIVSIIDSQNTKSILKALSKVSSPEKLVIARSKFKDGVMQFISDLPLKSLSLKGLGIERKDISPLKKMKNLTQLCLGQNNLQPVSLDVVLSLKRLEKLDLSSNNLDPSFIPRLIVLRSLKELVLDHNTKIQFKDLRILKALPLEVLHLCNTGITSHDVERIALEFRGLKSLYLGTICLHQDDLDAAKILNPDLKINIDFARVIPN